MVKFALSFSLMQKVAKHITGFLMALVILTASLQVSISKMTCYVAGETQYSVNEFEECSPKSTNGINKKCCDFDKITFDYNVNSTVNTYDIKLDKIATLIFEELPQMVKISILNKPFLNYFHNLPPPLSGIDLLKSIQVFRL